MTRINGLALAALMALGACGVEQAGTAATGAAIKKQELDQGKKTMEQAQQKIGAAVEQVQNRAADSEQK